MPLTDLWSVELVIAAFAGGAFGAAIGALPSFALTGLLVVLGETAAIARIDLDASGLPVDLTGAVAFGPMFGPHVAFAGVAAAAAYVARGEPRGSVGGSHPAKRITRGLGSRPDVLAVGGAFGVVGFGIATVAPAMGLPTDPVALGVVGSALAHRVAFSYSLFGAAPSRLLDLSSFEADRQRSVLSFGADGGAPDTTADPWLAYQYRWSHVLALGLVVGVLGGYLAFVTGSAFLAFGITVIPLGLLSAGMERVPVTHHMALPASTVVVAITPGVALPSAALSLAPALALAAGFGAVGALLGELAQRVFYAHAETHLDPPAVSIVLTSLLIAGFALVGVFPGAGWIPVG
jgi:hypothetical protein